MGNAPLEVPQADPTVLEDGYVWPENLYVELRDMASVAYLVYTFAYLTDTAREFGLKGLEINDEGRIGMPSRDLPRSFSPKEIIEIIENNLDTLKSRFKNFQDEEDYELTIKKLKILQDLLHSRNTMIGIRSTTWFTASPRMTSNWLSNVAFLKKEYDLPPVLEENGVVESLRLHSGFGKYIFDYTHDDDDPVTWRKYDEILEDVKLLLKEYPSYKVYVTGHSLGGALSSIVGVYLACDPDIPKPVSVINFASPRVGGRHFLLAARWLERRRWLRMLRVVNDNDTIAAMPMTNYHHIGMQVRLYKEIGREPIFTYPSEEESYRKFVGRLWQNSLITSLNLGYDHADYRERVDKDQLSLVKYDLNDLYDDPTLTGFKHGEETQRV
eukprot:scaffold2277_cov137-Cylindrotheca_fusiformis.AAC.1